MPTPGEIREQLLASNPEFQQLALRKSLYDAKLEQITKSPFLNSEDILEEIELKKLRLRVKDEMEAIFHRAWRQHLQPRGDSLNGGR
jgi:uncharacterized protein YdcH (DUF465 family)